MNDINKENFIEKFIKKVAEAQAKDYEELFSCDEDENSCKIFKNVVTALLVSFSIVALFTLIIYFLD